MRTRKEEARRAATLIGALENNTGIRLSPEVRKKVVKSYSIFVPMTCDLFTGLHGRTTTIAEKERLLLYFICSSLFDDFSDEKLLNNHQLREIMLHPATYQAQTAEEKLFIHASLRLRAAVIDKAGYEHVMEQLLESQLNSEKQFNPAIADEELEDITFSKGGNSLLLVHFYLDVPATEEECSCWYLLGAIIQLTNDLYDIYKDLQEGIHTLPNRMESAYQFRQYFDSIVLQLESHLHKLPYTHKRKHAFHLGLASICSFGHTALEQLVRLQGAAERLPPLHTVPRKELITDMEKAANIWACMKYCYLRTSTTDKIRPIALPADTLPQQEQYVA
ncbi:hypothetical protein [Chitinophaga sp. Cy-1792]|uniref:hypothetical protein n=1 Tax=Chitinophaga sp. Cy-1792 TaxID=2608339 RepID=UPI0014225358|nr:hypothetical protein [Chitinophaga sp. Cy-1792]NIG54714.1 hypothetical protein [Chitinophaga sp. Cy-1792]